MGLMRNQKARLAFIADDGGFTSVGVSITLLLAITLLFTAAQAYWVQSNAADIQYAADAGALAATNVVAEYVIVARVSDAVVLSMSLLSLSLFAVGAVAACIPYVNAVAEPLISAGQQVSRARDTFSKTAIAALERLQLALPFLCVANAVATISGNASVSSLGASYVGLALPIPLTGESVDLPDTPQEREAAETVEENNEEVSEASRKAQDALNKMNAAKLEGYLADCGNTGYSMYERAAVLAQMSGASNPYYASVDVWSFSVVLARAQSYYRARIAQEAPVNNSPEELARSVARKRFYQYARDTISSGYVTTDAAGATRAYLPLLPENTDAVRATILYSEHLYPLSTGEDGRATLHASTRCPACTQPSGYGAVRDIEDGSVAKCATCNFSVTTLGRAPAASTSIENGFEYHYRLAALAAQHYSEAAKTYANATREAKQRTEDSLDAFDRAVKALAAARYDPKPPGRFGCIALVFDATTHEAPDSLGAFTGVAAHIGPRVAISAAMLAPDTPEKGANVVSSLLSGLERAEGDFSGEDFIGKVVSLWGDLLLAYLEGSDALIEGVGSFLEKIPLIGGDELSGWAEQTLRDLLELMGLEPVKMESLKPVLVNSSFVLRADTTGVGERIAGVGQAYTSLPGSGSGTIAASVFDGLLILLRSQASEALSASYPIATIELLGEGGPTYEIQVTLPKGVIEGAERALDSVEGSARDVGAGFVGAGEAWR